MKRIIKAAAVLMAVLMLFTLGSCGNNFKNVKMINGETFVAEAEAMGFTVSDLLTEEYSSDYYSLYEATNDEVYIQYFYAKDDNISLQLYNNDYATTIEKLTESDIREEASSYMYSRLSVTFAEDGRYVVVVRSGGTHMYIECTAQARVSVDKFLENISY